MRKNLIFGGCLFFLLTLMACIVSPGPVPSSTADIEDTPLEEGQSDPSLVTPDSTQSPQPAPSVTATVQTLHLIDRTHTVVSESPAYAIDLTWPNLPNDVPQADIFNSAVNGWVDSLEADFLQILSELEISGALAQAAVPSDLMMGYEAAFVSSDLVSVQLQVYEYVASAAHPGIFSKSFNFDITSGRWLSLASLFKAETDVVGRLLPIIEPELIQREIGYWPGSAEIALQEGVTWTLLEEGLKINFDNRVSPYAGGPQSVLIPWADLADALDPEGPAAWVLMP